MPELDYATAERILRERASGQRGVFRIEDVIAGIQDLRRFDIQIADVADSAARLATRASEEVSADVTQLVQTRDVLGAALSATTHALYADLSPNMRAAEYADGIWQQFMSPIQKLVEEQRMAMYRLRNLAETDMSWSRKTRTEVSDLSQSSSRAEQRHREMVGHIIKDRETFGDGALSTASRNVSRFREDDLLVGKLIEQIRTVGWTSNAQEAFQELSEREQRRVRVWGEIAQTAISAEREMAGDDVAQRSEVSADRLSRSSYELENAFEQLRAARSRVIDGSSPGEVAGTVNAAIDNARRLVHSTAHELVDEHEARNGWKRVSAKLEQVVTDAGGLVQRDDDAPFQLLFDQAALRAKIEVAQTFLAMEAETSVESSPELKDRFGLVPEDAVERDHWRTAVGKTRFLAQVLGHGKDSLFARQPSGTSRSQSEFISEQVADISTHRSALGLAPIPAFESRDLGPDTGVAVA